MHRARWQSVERLLNKFSIRPIVAVIPNNQDPALFYDEVDQDFWKRVRKWQDAGWEIALHGYSHVIKPTTVRQCLPFYDHSEFSGLSYEDQRFKLLAGIEIFERHRVKTRTFVAPAHCFDQTTVRVIANETGISFISDGIALNCFYKHGLVWIPQQLSRFSPKPFGLWTICLHPNTCNESALDELNAAFDKHGQSFTDVDRLGRRIKRRKSIIYHINSARYWYNRRRLMKLLINT
jgi:hypothetical protein